MKKIEDWVCTSALFSWAAGLIGLCFIIFGEMHAAILMQLWAVFWLIIFCHESKGEQ